MYRAMIDALQRLEQVVGREKIECDFHRGGTLTLGRSAAQMLRLNDEVSELRAYGFGPDDVVLLTKEEASARIAASGALGAMYTPHCARIHPAKLVTGLARVVSETGGVIFEHSSVSEIFQGGLVAQGFRVEAEMVIRATEAYTVRLPASRRAVAPVYSMMIATTPIAEDVWGEIGWAERETLTDGRRVIIYAQRTADDRIAFGGRGAPYHFGSSITDAFDENPQVRELLREALVELFPMLARQEIAYHWGGPIGVPRDFMPSVGVDRGRGFGWAGGYVGDGVTTTFLAGETLAHLINGESSELTDLCWVGATSRGWEPEPLRWLGINGTLWASRQADRREVGSTLGSWQGRLADAISGS
jgi:glycine/D-amino acid oxidase-like deaminating enzyme